MVASSNQLSKSQNKTCTILTAYIGSRVWEIDRYQNEWA